MVARRLRLNCLILIAFLMAPLDIAYADIFHITLSQSQVELGKPLTVIVTYNGVSPSLETLNLEELRKYFYISAPPQAEHRGRQQRWVLRLFAYDVGEFMLPALHIANHHPAPSTITVSPAIDPKDGSLLEFSSSVSTLTPWLKQQVTITTTLTSASSIQVMSTHEPLQAGLVIRPSGPQTQPIDGSLPVRYQHQVAWQLHSTHQGDVTLDNIFVYLQRDGVRTHQFVLRPIKLTVLPLPSYLPATIPVGHLSLETSLPKQWQFTGSLSMMLFKLHARNMLESDIPNLLQQLNTAPKLKFYDAQIDTQTVATPSLLTTTQIYHIPFMANEIGIVRLPPVRLQYFDPDQSRLMTITYPSMWFLSVYRWLVFPLIAIGGWIIYWLVGRIIRHIKRHWNRYRGYQLAKHQWQRVDSPQALRHVLQQIAIAEGWPINLSLSAWQQHWNQRYPQRHAPVFGFRLLKSALYSKQTVALPELRVALQPLICWHLFG